MARSVRSVYRPKTIWSAVLRAGVFAALAGVVLLLLGLRVFGDLVGSDAPTYAGLVLFAGGIGLAALAVVQDRPRH